MIYEKEKRYIIPFDDVPSSRAEMPEISVDERRGNYAEVETGFSEEDAIREAKRCLSCRRCLGCALCWAECEPEAIDFNIQDDEFDFDFDDLVITRGQDNSFEAIDSKLGYGNYADVITDLQFERMLSPTGPTDGLVLSPKDGEIPERIAIIQGTAKADEEHLLSTAVLGVNESIIALDRTKDLIVTLISPISAAFRDKFLAEAKKVSGLMIVEGEPITVKRSNDSNRLVLTFSDNGKEKEESFDMIVVLTKSKLSRELQSLSKKLEQDII